MLQHDYIIDMIEKFCMAVAHALERFLFENDFKAAEDVEQAVGQLVGLDADAAMVLDPNSLVLMFQLSGVGESVAGYAAYALDRLADVYEDKGEAQLAQVRRSQAEAIAEAFNCDLCATPEGFEEIEQKLAQ